jgi:hypothetical protein
MTLFRSISIKSAVTKIAAAFGLWPLNRTWRTFPGARLSNGQGLKAVTRTEVA